MDTDFAGEAVGAAAGVFERVPALFEEEALLRIDERGFVRGVAEKRGIEALFASEETVGGHVVWMGA